MRRRIEYRSHAAGGGAAAGAGVMRREPTVDDIRGYPMVGRPDDGTRAQGLNNMMISRVNRSGRRDGGGGVMGAVCQGSRRNGRGGGWRTACGWVALIIVGWGVLGGSSSGAAWGQAILRVPSEYAAIQAAIDAATDGDSVLVASGTYVEQIDFRGKAITVESEEGSEVTTIDGNEQGPVVTFENGEDWKSVLRGFKITNGWTRRLRDRFDVGAGIFIRDASPFLEDLHVTTNGVDRWAPGKYYYVYGQGIYAENSAFTLRHSRVSGGYVCYDCGTVEAGGAIYLTGSSARIEWCEVSGYVSSYGDGGGAIRLTNGSDVAILGSQIDGTTGEYASGGGGIYADAASILFVGGCFIQGTADGGGGALKVTRGAAVFASGSSFWGRGEGASRLSLTDGSFGQFEGCTFEGMSSRTGTAVLSASDVTLVLEHCVVRNNRSIDAYDAGAGGMSISRGDVTILDSHFEDNVGYNGGHLNLWECPHVEILGTTFAFGVNGSVASQDGFGGAVALNGVTDALIRDCVFIDNWGLDGGAIAASRSHLTLENSHFIGNEAGSGAAVHATNSTVIASHLLIHDSRIWIKSGVNVHPPGGVIAVTGDGEFDAEFVTIARTHIDDDSFYEDALATGLIALTDGLVHVRHSILRPEQPDYPAPTIYTEFGTPLQVDNSNIDGGWDGFGAGNFDFDAGFVDPDAGDYRLKDGSPCINAGDPAFVPDPDAVDLDGNPRLISCIVDVGAYEATPSEAPVVLTLSRLVRGETARMQVTCAEPGEEVIFFATREGIGSGPIIPELGGLRLDLLEPVREVARREADANGVATVLGRLRPKFGWRKIYVQAGIARGLLGSDSIKSAVVGRRVADP